VLVKNARHPPMGFAGRLTKINPNEACSPI
jgi:hypothetical protein